MPSPREAVRNARLLLQSAAQHLVDDPALLAVQVSRRLPFSVRVGAGRALRAVAEVLPGGQGRAALGAYMAGDDDRCARTHHREIRFTLADPGRGRRDLGRIDLLSAQLAPATRARAAWTRGESQRGTARSSTTPVRGPRGMGDGLRSELQLLEPGYQLTAAPAMTWHRERHSPVRGTEIIAGPSSAHQLSSAHSVRLLAAQPSHPDVASRPGIDSVALTRTGYPVMVGKPCWRPTRTWWTGSGTSAASPRGLAQTQEERLLAEASRAIELVDEFRPARHPRHHELSQRTGRAGSRRGHRPAVGPRGAGSDGEDLDRFDDLRRALVTRRHPRRRRAWCRRARRNSRPVPTPS